MISQVIVIPQYTRDCMLVDGHRYCQDDVSDPKHDGAMILIIVAIIAYVVFLTWLTFEKENMLILIIGILAPLTVVGLCLLSK